MPETKILAQRLKMIRKTLHQSQEEFAWSVGISVEELSLLERNKTNFTIDVLQRIAAYTGLTCSELLDLNISADEKQKIKSNSR